MEVLFFFIGNMIAAFGQVLLKLSVESKKMLMFLIGGYVLLFSVTLINLFVFKKLPAKIMIISPVSIFLILTFLSKTILGERDIKYKNLGYYLIILGIMIFLI